MGLLTGAAILYYGQPLLDKMNAEIGRLMEKVAGPKGVQYSLRATASGDLLPGKWSR